MRCRRGPAGMGELDAPAGASANRCHEHSGGRGLAASDDQTGHGDLRIPHKQRAGMLTELSGMPACLRVHSMLEPAA
jgi:hypothetical protein